MANFDDLKRAVMDRPDQLIRLAIAADPICQPCPHRRDTSCETADTIDPRDQGLLDQMGYAAGDVFALDVALAAVALRFLDLQAHVCQGCKWLTFCRDIQISEQSASTIT
ncbi:MAG: DUF1284 domain-containing protein [Candidatus Sericytochromatia bacterium]|nr:DUF1284 domain-containing protein [Candidatus Sericytochromatia bacterium]